MVHHHRLLGVLHAVIADASQEKLLRHGLVVFSNNRYRCLEIFCLLAKHRANAFAVGLILDDVYYGRRLYVVRVLQGTLGYEGLGPFDGLFVGAGLLIWEIVAAVVGGDRQLKPGNDMNLGTEIHTVVWHNLEYLSEML